MLGLFHSPQHGDEYMKQELGNWNWLLDTAEECETVWVYASERDLLFRV